MYIYLVHERNRLAGTSLVIAAYANEADANQFIHDSPVEPAISYSVTVFLLDSKLMETLKTQFERQM